MFEIKIRTDRTGKMQAVAQYRLTDPSKLVRALFVLGLAIWLSIAGITGSVATSGSPQALDYLTVGQGDTLWSLALEHAQGDPRDWIAEVVTLNALASSDLTPGQQIALP
jgi:LysM repeat protein